MSLASSWRASQSAQEDLDEVMDMDFGAASEVAFPWENKGTAGLASGVRLCWTYSLASRARIG